MELFTAHRHRAKEYKETVYSKKKVVRCTADLKRISIKNDVKAYKY